MSAPTEDVPQQRADEEAAAAKTATENAEAERLAEQQAAAEKSIVTRAISRIPDYDALAIVVVLQHWGGSRRLTNALLGKEDKLAIDPMDDEFRKQVEQFIRTVRETKWKPKTVGQIIFGFIVAFYQLPHSDGFRWTEAFWNMILGSPIEMVEAGTAETFDEIAHLPQKWKDDMANDEKTFYDKLLQVHDTQEGDEENVSKIQSLLSTIKSKRTKVLSPIERTMAKMTVERPDWLLEAAAAKFKTLMGNSLPPLHNP